MYNTYTYAVTELKKHIDSFWSKNAEKPIDLRINSHSRGAVACARVANEMAES